MPSDAPHLRHTIRFTGRVQGVGFRATTVRVASDHDVAGYVRNMPDGSVECVVEGSTAALQSFLQDLLTVMARYVRQHSVLSAPATGEFGDPRSGVGVEVRY